MWKDSTKCNCLGSVSSVTSRIQTNGNAENDGDTMLGLDDDVCSYEELVEDLRKVSEHECVPKNAYVKMLLYWCSILF